METKVFKDKIGTTIITCLTIITIVVVVEDRTTEAIKTDVEDEAQDVVGTSTSGHMVYVPTVEDNATFQ